MDRMSEKALQASVVRAARSLGWRDAWTWKSYHSPKGWPDLVLAKGLRLLIVELKAEKGKLTPEQETWLAWWRQYGQAMTDAFDRVVDPGDVRPSLEVYVWRPADLDEAYAILARP